MKSKNKYCIDLDVMRIIASIAVVLIHVSAQNWYGENNIKYFSVLNFYDSLARFAVPMFLMITGTLLLNKNKELNLKEFLKKHLLKMIILYIVWSVFYCFADNILLKRNFKIGFNEIIYYIVYSKYLLWYLRVLICLYIFIPFIKIVINNCKKEYINYFLILFFIFGILFHHLSNLSLPSNLNIIINKIRIVPAFWYSGYLVLGWYLYNNEISKNNRIKIYIIGIISLLVCFICTNLYANPLNLKTELFYDNFSLTTFFYTISLFVFIKYFIKNIRVNEKILKLLSSKTFGIYLIHAFILDLLMCLGITVKICNPIISVPVITILVYLISYILICIIKKIPLLNKLV